MTATNKSPEADLYVVWRRSDGYVAASTSSMPKDWPGFTFTKLGEFCDWKDAYELIAQNRKE
jgi:hypothetical protein